MKSPEPDEVFPSPAKLMSMGSGPSEANMRAISVDSIKLVQLPVPEISGIFTRGNIPLAAGYLKAYAVNCGAASSDEITIIPRDMANFAGDAAILKWLTERETKITGFTSYMWNLDRNLALARRIKESRPDIIVVFGGPEICPGQPILNEMAIDCFIMGEGEKSFSEFLRDYAIHSKPLKRIYTSETLLDLSTLPNPYLENIITPFTNESIFIETMRGCPYLCKYCFYSKTRQSSSSNLRFFPGDYLPRLFEKAREQNVSEIYIMDPSFNVVPNLGDRLKLMGQLNPTKIPIHTEIRLESLTPEIAALMEKAGFLSVEVGLQSINPKALSAINRSWNKKKFIEGAKLLQGHGIDVKTGIILGLPNDTPDHFMQTLDFLIDLNLDSSMEAYLLSLIPGTQLRDEAEQLGISYMPHPPYWVTSTPQMQSNDLTYAIEMMEQKLMIEFYSPIAPHFNNPLPDYIHFLDCREKLDSNINLLMQQPEKAGHSITIMLGKKIDKIKLGEFAKCIINTNPYTLFQIVLDRDTLPRVKEAREISSLFFQPDHYFNHIHRYKIDNQERYSVRMFHLTSNLDLADSYLYENHYCDLIFRYTTGAFDSVEELLNQNPLLLVDAPIKKTEVRKLRQLYEGFEGLLIIT